MDYIMLSTASLNEVILDKENIDTIARNIPIANFHLRKNVKLLDVVVDERPKKIVLNFTYPLMLGVIDEEFLTSFISMTEAKKYIELSRIFVQKNLLNRLSICCLSVRILFI